MGGAIAKPIKRLIPKPYITLNGSAVKIRFIFQLFEQRPVSSTLGGVMNEDEKQAKNSSDALSGWRFCLLVMWVHSHLILAEGVRYLQIMQAEKINFCSSYGLCLQAVTSTYLADCSA